ncbi:MAG: MAE_28990/MAE_18760 family HEPN-like nuclease [Lachnospiraceae bacterium]
MEEFNDAIIAAALSREYSSFEDTNRKCKELTSIPPAEDFLHRYHRRKELTKVFTSDYVKRKIRIQEKLLRLSNSVAHGSQRNPIDFDELIKIEQSIISLIEEIIQYLYDVCVNERYLKEG